MSELAAGARPLPLRHLTIRVPWNDSGWTGIVCQRPVENLACRVLPRIRDNKDDTAELALTGVQWDQLAEKDLPPCVGEHGGFMAPYELTRRLSHPYASFSEAHRHMLPTPFRYPPYSAACLPFNWMRRESAVPLARALGLEYVPELEDAADQEIGFKTEWLQDKHNQLVMVDTFFSAVQPRRSLCFFYAKRTPLSEDRRRVIVGVGRATGLGSAVEYEYSGPGELKSVLWERTVQHSIRPSFSDGVVFPYHEVLSYLEAHPEEDASPYIAFAPDEFFESFSYGTEHVTNDGAIASLLVCVQALRKMASIVAGPWDHVLEWLDQRLSEMWRMRGPCPGLGAALTAFGVASGTLVAFELERTSGNPADGIAPNPWPLVEQVFDDPTVLPAGIREAVSVNLRKKWQALPRERMELLKLLSRFQLSADQATRYYVREDSGAAVLLENVSDTELLQNPYLFYELDRNAPDAIGLEVIDRGVFPDRVIRERYPLDEPSLVTDPVDSRRVRAFVVGQLEQAAGAGDTLRSRKQVIQGIRALPVEPGCPVDSDLLPIVEESFGQVVQRVALADGQPAYQLGQLQKVGEKIRGAIEKRVRGKRHAGQVDWRKALDAALNQAIEPSDVDEERARNEKAAALEELHAARVSVLIGPAGTGKTTLLKVLCAQPEVTAGGILLLAPTGKARVRMENQIGLRGAKTIAQFLLPLDRYDPRTGIYHLADRQPVDAGQTLIIDEASMLTEEQLAAVIDALRGVERLILVGDPRQLPPIGAGRPFLDIVTRLTPASVESRFPRVGPGYAELTVRRRQKGEVRNDLLLAEWFSGRPLGAAADEIWADDQLEKVSSNLRLLRWDNPDELESQLIGLLAEKLELKGVDDWQGLERSLGGTVYGQGVYFWPGRNGEAGACAKAEAWQILSPVRNTSYGVQALNRLLQSTFRSRTRDYALAPDRRIPQPMGAEGILYGDKVIQVTNERRNDVWPKENAEHYVANGELGIAVGQFKTKNAGYKGLPWKLEVEFSSQPGFKYGYGKGDFGDEGDAKLELAYALTVHKCQGSEFGWTIVILPVPCRLLSRELLYTALTRQREHVVILHQGDRSNLLRYSSDYYSEAAGRLTNLFRAPNPVQLQDRFLEEKLIHRTRRGESVRSKSEVIVADMLFSKKVDYQYEQPLVGSDGRVRYPDFTIEDAEAGITYYWEHLGMLSDPGYRQGWEAKLGWYREQGILPQEEGGGPNGALITSEDDQYGGIDSGAIERRMDALFSA